MIADVIHPILGADFLRNFNLLVDLKHRKLIDGKSFYRCRCRVFKTKVHSITAKPHDVKIKDLLQEFPGLTQLMTSRKAKVEYGIQHYIVTNGHPVNCKPRRMTPEMEVIARKAFNEMMKQGECRKSNSEWTSPLHQVPKKDKKGNTIDWRFVGDYCALNAIIVKDRYPVPNILDFNKYIFGKKTFYQNRYPESFLSD